MSLINIKLTTDWSVVSWWHTTSMDTKTNTPTDQQALAAPKDKPVGRRRLPPALRVQQILDNALLEFEEHGFQAARMETIAQRSGLSKGGLYAHFDSKEQLFEALLTRSIAMPDVKQMDLTRIFHCTPRNEDGIALVCPKIEVLNLDQRAGNAETKLYRKNGCWNTGLWPLGPTCGGGQI